MKYFPVGKLDFRLLEKLLNSNPIKDTRVIVGPRIGEDAAVIDFGNKYLVAKTDPITFTTHRIGWLREYFVILLKQLNHSILRYAAAIRKFLLRLIGQLL